MSTRYRVLANTSPAINKRIYGSTKSRVRYYAQHPDQISARLKELNAEWDIERLLETGSASLSLVGLTLGISRDKKWLWLPLLVQGFFLQHAVQGWCPPLPLLRRLGVRTLDEIDLEREALKSLRDEFLGAPPFRDATREAALQER